MMLSLFDVFKLVPVELSVGTSRCVGFNGVSYNLISSSIS